VSWWIDLKDVMSDLFPPKRKESEPLVPRKPFVPPHASQPDDKPQGEWPSKDERQ
jgi:hypothetical protein